MCEEGRSGRELREVSQTAGGTLEKETLESWESPGAYHDQRDHFP